MEILELNVLKGSGKGPKDKGRAGSWPIRGGLLLHSGMMGSVVQQHLVSSFRPTTLSQSISIHAQYSIR